MKICGLRTNPIQSPTLWRTPMRTIKVTFSNGDTITTSINGTDEQIRRYYIGQPFNFGDRFEGDPDNVQTAIAVEFLS